MVTVLNLNIFRGFHTQFLKTCYNWEIRKTALLEFVKKINADVLLFQECNKLEHSTSVDEFMKNFPEYDYTIYYSGSIIQSRALLIGFKKYKFEKISDGQKWLSDYPDVPSDTWTDVDAWGRIIAYNKLKTLDGKEFYVFNTHFDISYYSIVKSIELLPSIINDIVNIDDVVLIGGDFNNSYDRLFDMFSLINFTCASLPIKTIDNNQINFTFIGKRNKYGEYECEELLDFIFVKNIEKYDVRVSLSSIEIEKEYVLSDHLPLFIKFFI
jgi:endonuclease/exonuclease/phosphatase family metal-dependent hydrolase